MRQLFEIKQFLKKEKEKTKQRYAQAFNLETTRLSSTIRIVAGFHISTGLIVVTSIYI